MVFDDYGFRQCDGITRIVEEARAMKDCIAVYNLNGHAILVKAAAPKC
jgi:hypothetical protein